MKLLKLSILILSLIVVSCKPAKYADLADGLYANLETNKGDILLKLEFEKTPITVANFVSLVEGNNDFVTDSLKGKAYYDGTIFHRVIPDFMIQAGDPLGTGSGDPGYKFADEFHPELNFDRPYLLAMANSGPGTNGSQFFITVAATAWLNRKHSIFGEVTDVASQAIVDAIATTATGAQDRPIEAVKINSVSLS